MIQGDLFPACPWCGGLEVIELLEVWNDREFSLETCCQGLHEELCYEMDADPKFGAALLRRLRVDELTGRRIRRVVDDGACGLVMDWNLELRDVHQGDAKAFVRDHHEHNPPPAGDKFRASIYNGDTLLGVCMVGRPTARQICQRTVVEVTRLCLDRRIPTALRWNACSQLYGWAAREAKRRGYRRIITYTLESEPGTSLIAAGWTIEARTKGGSWNTPSRPRVDKAPTEPKVRWGRQLAA